VGCDRRLIGVAETAEHTKVVIIRRCVEEELMGSEWFSCGAGSPVEEVCGCGEHYSPVHGRHRGLEQKRTNTIIEGAQDPLGLHVLLGSVGTG
jgi:hypothetical protein